MRKRCQHSETLVRSMSECVRPALLFLAVGFSKVFRTPAACKRSASYVSRGNVRIKGAGHFNTSPAQAKINPARVVHALSMAL